MKSTLKMKVLVFCLLASLVVFGYAQQETPYQKFIKARDAVKEMAAARAVWEAKRDGAKAVLAEVQSNGVVAA